LTRYTARAAAMYEETAAGVLSVLNQALLRQRNDFRFTTLTCCVLELRDGAATLRVAAAGHPPPLGLSADGKAREVPASGPLLGVIPDAEFSETEVALVPGDAVVLYTDGLTDARAPERVMSTAELLAELERCGSRGAAELLACLEEVALAGEDEARDDIALLALRLAGG